MEAVNAGRIVVEVLDTHGRVSARERFAVGDTGKRRIVVGRSVAADVIVDDPHVAAAHVAIDVDGDGRVVLTDLGSRNGFIVDAHRHRGLAGHPLAHGEFKIGRTRLRVRTGRETLAPERADHEMDLSLMRNVSRVALVCALLWLAMVVYVTWLDAPRDMPTALAGALSVALALAAVWVSIWAVLGRMLQGEWRWLTHGAIFFGVSGLVFVLDTLLDIGWFAAGLSQGQWRETLLITLGLALVLYLHLTNVSALKRRTALLFAALLPALMVGTATWVQARNQARDVNYIGVREKLYPPMFRLRAGIGVEEYFTNAAELKVVADRKRKDLPSSDADAGDELIE